MPQKLLDLPPEIFQDIVHELVRDAGVKEAWKLRSTCRAFAAEIHDDIFARQSKEVLSAYLDGSGHGTILVSNMNLYLTNRMEARLDADGGLVPKLNAMLDYLVAELQIEDAKQRKGYAKQLAKNIMRLLNAPSYAALVMLIKSMLWALPSKRVWITKRNTRLRDSCAAVATELTAEDKLCAAVSIGASNLVRELFEIAAHSCDGEYFDPMEIAIKMGNDEMVDILLECGERVRLNVNPHAFWTKSTWLTDSVPIALRYRNVIALKSLLRSVKASHHHQAIAGYKRIVLSWLYKATSKRFWAALNPLLEACKADDEDFTYDFYTIICQSHDALKYCIAKGLIDVNQRFERSSPLVIATQHGVIKNMALLIAAGAQVNLAAGDHTTALEAACHSTNKGVINYLLDQGASFENLRLDGMALRRTETVLKKRAREAAKSNPKRKTKS